MRIQFISYDGEEIYQTKETIICNSFNNAKSFDEFDINIISLQNEGIWRNEGTSNTHVDCFNDLISLNTQIHNSKKSYIIVLLPQNYYFKYYKKPSGKGYYHVEQLKDLILYWAQVLLTNSLFHGLFNGTNIKYDNSTTVISDRNIESTFSFIPGYEIVTKSTGNQITTIRLHNRIYLTGLRFKSEGFDLDSFLKVIGLVENKVEIPDWLVNYKFFNDDELLMNLENEKERLKLVKEKINDIQSEIDENMNYKVALISSGDELVSIVFNILQEILACDLSDYIDNKEADFIIKKDDVTFVGEIKGVNSNVLRKNVSQTEQHCSDYLDELDENSISENVKGILIITPFRKTAISEREPVHIDVIEWADKRDILVVTTDILLEIFEKYKQNEINSDSIINLLKEKTGLLTENDF
ncbi:MAG: hypothetical protein HFJ97_06870 [Eubacterium sp.]|nr:hypothetical protein [Eubacterium sp.]